MRFMIDGQTGCNTVGGDCQNPCSEPGGERVDSMTNPRGRTLRSEHRMADPILARQVDASAFLLVGLALVGLALYLRLRIFIGTQPGGVDTWYYLASAEAIRRQRRLPISLPQYLPHDPTESYPPVFPLVLAAPPPRLPRPYFWPVTPV